VEAVTSDVGVDDVDLARESPVFSSSTMAARKPMCAIVSCWPIAGSDAPCQRRRAVAHFAGLPTFMNGTGAPA